LATKKSSPSLSQHSGRGARKHERRNGYPDARPRFAMVLSGGGARGAYEAGVIHYLRTQLPPELGESPLFQLYCGTSVGAINCAFMAATAHDPVYQGKHIWKLWNSLTSKDIYYTDTQALFTFLAKTGYFAATNMLGLYRLLEKRYGTLGPFTFKSVLDTTPFVFYLRRNISWFNIHKNINSRIIDAFTISATHINTGLPAIFVEKHPDVHFREGGIHPIFTSLSPKHILASAALPIIFPLIRINQQYFGDGSLRQNTPISPAIQLGADHLFIIALRPPSAAVPIPSEPMADLQMPQVLAPQPPLGTLAGQLLNSIFLDKLDYDLNQLQRINYLIRDMEQIFGNDALERINRHRREMMVPGKVIHEMRKVRPFTIQPTENLGKVAAQSLRKIIASSRAVSPMHRFFGNLLEDSPHGENDLVSYLMFEKEYIETLLDLGYQDAKREHDHLVEFFSCLPLSHERRANHHPPFPFYPEEEVLGSEE